MVNTAATPRYTEVYSLYRGLKSIQRYTEPKYNTIYILTYIHTQVTYIYALRDAILASDDHEFACMFAVGPEQPRGCAASGSV